MGSNDRKGRLREDVVCLKVVIEAKAFFETLKCVTLHGVSVFRLPCRLSLFILEGFALEVLAAKVDEVMRVGPDDFFGEVLQDLGELLGHLDLVG